MRLLDQGRGFFEAEVIVDPAWVSLSVCAPLLRLVAAGPWPAATSRVRLRGRFWSYFSDISTTLHSRERRFVPEVLVYGCHNPSGQHAAQLVHLGLEIMLSSDQKDQPLVWLPSPDHVMSVHNELVAVFADEDDPISPPGIRSYDLLVSACARPNVALGSREKYPTVFGKAAALFHSLVKNHAFHNGNKRTALVTLLSTLQRNNYYLNKSVSDQDVHDLALAVTADAFPTPNHGFSVDEIVDHLITWLRERSIPTNPQVSSMTLDDFVSRCQEAGARTRDAKGGTILIQNGMESIRISKSTRQLNGQAVVKYLSTLKLGLTSIGLSPQEFQTGVSPERQQIYRFIVALRRLAKT